APGADDDVLSDPAKGTDDRANWSDEGGATPSGPAGSLAYGYIASPRADGVSAAVYFGVQPSCDFASRCPSPPTCGSHAATPARTHMWPGGIEWSARHPDDPLDFRR